MAIVPMSKISIFGHISERSAVVRRLQLIENVEIASLPDSIETEDVSSDLAIIERQIALINSALNILKPYDKEKAQLFKSKDEVAGDAYKTAKKNREEILKHVYDAVNTDKKITEDTVAIARLKAQISSYEPWKDFDIPLDFAGTKNTAAFMGNIPSTVNFDEMYTALEERFSAVFAMLINKNADVSAIAVFCMKSDKFDVESMLRSFGFSKPSFELTSNSAKGEIEHLSSLIDGHEKSIEESKNNLELLCGKKHDIQLLYDYLLTAKERRLARSKIGNTDQSFVIDGFTPTESAEEIKKSLESEFCCHVIIGEIAEDEIMPIKFRNNAFVAPVEPVTEMFSYPTKDDVDPNPVMSVFYYIFFGLMLSDAGYGLLLFFGGLFITKKFKPEGTFGKLVKMFTLCGIGTTIWGALFGSWFGDIIQQVGRVFFDVQIGELGIYNPITDPMPLLILSFVLGGIHLFAAMGVNFYNLCRHGKVWDAIFDIGFWYLLLIGLVLIIPMAPLGTGILGAIGKYMAIAGAVGLVLTQGRSKKNIFARILGGFTGLYSVTSYLSDLLSYSRLLALGLATGVISNVVNTMAVMGGKGIVGAVMLVIIFLLGHTLNLLINLLGAYVHTNRLHYVEFFQKFYEGGGKKFTPFGLNTKYTKTKKV